MIKSGKKTSLKIYLTVKISLNNGVKGQVLQNASLIF